MYPHVVSNEGGRNTNHRHQDNQTKTHFSHGYRVVEEKIPFHLETLQDVLRLNVGVRHGFLMGFDGTKRDYPGLIWTDIYPRLSETTRDYLRLATTVAGG